MTAVHETGKFMINGIINVYKEKGYCAYDAFYQTGNQWGYANTFFKRYDPLSTTIKANNYTFKPWNRQIPTNTNPSAENKI